MPIKTTEVTSLTQFLSSVKSIRAQWPQTSRPTRSGEAENLWFRGQRVASWGLIPKLHRPEYRGATEAEIRHEFQSRALELLSGHRPADKWEWYFLMQHYGVPTRLLDWTENPLVALYFAVEDKHEEYAGRPAAVWVIDPWWLNRKLRRGIEGPMLHDWSEADSFVRELENEFAGTSVTRALPAAIEAPYIDRRMSAQGSRFIIFGSTHDFTKVHFVKEKDCRLIRITVSPESIQGIAQELEVCGFTAPALFPDLSHLSEHICQRWKK
jgi:hypothetical protein